MNRNRREFLRASAIGASIISSPNGISWAAGAPVRMSMEKFLQLPNRVEQLRTLFREMRKKKASDPASYFFQAATHWFPDLSPSSVAQRPHLKVLAEIFNADPDAKKAVGYWDQCSHMGVKTPADFTLWHRAFLYYFERHARNTLGDPTFAIPYWNYGQPTAAARRLPAPFLGEKLLTGGENPLYPLGGLQRFLNSATAELDSSDVSADECMKNDVFFSEAGIEGFGDVIGSAKAIDYSPHGLVHGGIGGWMGSVSTAGFDPVFWVHHSNIDRLFNQWMSKQRYWSKSMSPQEVNSWLDSSPYSFMDVGGKIESKPRRFFLETKNLGYAYDSDPAMIYPPTLPPNAAVFAQAPSTTKSLASLPVEIKGFTEQGAGGTSQAVSVSAAKGVTITVPMVVPPAVTPTTSGGKVPLAVTAQQSGKHNYTVLDLRDVKKTGEFGGVYGVFVGPLASEAKDSSSPAFVGRFSSFEAPEIDFTGRGSNHRFDITRQIADFGSKNLDKLVVRIVPMPSSKQISDLDRPGTLVIKQVEIRSLKGSTLPLK